MGRGKAKDIVIMNDISEIRLASKVVYSSTLLHTRTLESLTTSEMISSIQHLIKGGCSAFLVVGDKEEEIHDLIDNLVIDINSARTSHLELNVVTTFHPNEEFYDALSIFFLDEKSASRDAAKLLAVVPLDAKDILFEFKEQYC